MSQKLIITKEIEPGLLWKELRAVDGLFFYDVSAQAYETKCNLFEFDGAWCLLFPEAVDASLVQAVVDAHDKDAVDYEAEQAKADAARLSAVAASKPEDLKAEDVSWAVVYLAQRMLAGEGSPPTPPSPKPTAAVVEV